MRAVDLESGIRIRRLSSPLRESAVYAYALQSQPQEGLLLGVGEGE